MRGGVNGEARSPEDEDRAIEFERQSDVAHLLDDIDARLSAIKPEPRDPREVVGELLAGARRAEVSHIFELYEAWLSWNDRLEVELEVSDFADEIVETLEDLLQEAVSLNERSLRDAR